MSGWSTLAGAPMFNPFASLVHTWSDSSSIRGVFEKGKGKPNMNFNF